MPIKPTAALIALVSLPAFGQVAADLQYGQGDAYGMVLFFYLFFCYVHIKDEFKRSETKGRLAVLYCTAFGVASWFFYPLQLLMALIFLWSFLSWTWDHFK